MRYVFYAFAALGLMAVWMNVTDDGQRAKRHLMSGHGTENAG